MIIEANILQIKDKLSLFSDHSFIRIMGIISKKLFVLTVLLFKKGFILYDIFISHVILKQIFVLIQSLQLVFVIDVY